MDLIPGTWGGLPKALSRGVTGSESDCELYRARAVLGRDVWPAGCAGDSAICPSGKQKGVGCITSRCLQQQVPKWVTVGTWGETVVT